jgi:exopolysaccharide production protein ExoZ
MTATAEDVRSHPILPIQYLRGLAALAVVWHHATHQVSGMAAFLPWGFGSSGVDVFFVISGFIMVVTTWRGRIAPTEFWRRRFIRVVPLYWLLTLLMIAVAWVAPSLFKTLKVTPTTLLQSLFFIPHFSQSFPGSVWPLLVPGWTLNFEMFFYAVFGALLVLPRTPRLQALVAVLVALVGIGALFGPFQSAAAQTYTQPMLLEFAGGALVGAWWSSGRRSLPTADAIVFLASGTLMLVLRDQGPLGFATQIVGALLVVVGALGARFAWMPNAFLRALGDASYSLYLTHLFTLGALRAVWVRAWSGPANGGETAAFMAIGCAACALVGWLTFRWVEAPLLALLSRRRRPSLRAASPDLRRLGGRPVDDEAQRRTHALGP